MGQINSQAGGKPATHVVDGATHPIGYSRQELPTTLDGKLIEWDVTFSAGDGTGDGIVVGHAKDAPTSSS